MTSRRRHLITARMMHIYDGLGPCGIFECLISVELMNRVIAGESELSDRQISLLDNKYSLWEKEYVKKRTEGHREAVMSDFRKTTSDYYLKLKRD